MVQDPNLPPPIPVGALPLPPSKTEQIAIGALIALLMRLGVIDGKRKLPFLEVIELAGKYIEQAGASKEGTLTLYCRVCSTTHDVAVVDGWSRAPIKELAYVCSQACRDEIFKGAHLTSPNHELEVVRAAHVRADKALSELLEDTGVRYAADPEVLTRLEKELEGIRRLTGISLPEEEPHRPIRKLDLPPPPEGTLPPEGCKLTVLGEKEAELDDDAKRLLMAMQWGILIQNADGHRWIEADEIKYPKSQPEEGWDHHGLDCCPGPLNKLLREKDLEEVASKCYGDFRDALNGIDSGLADLGEPSLLEQYEKRGGDAAWGLHCAGKAPPRRSPYQGPMMSPPAKCVRCGKAMSRGTLCSDCADAGVGTSELTPAEHNVIRDASGKCAPECDAPPPHDPGHPANKTCCEIGATHQRETGEAASSHPGPCGKIDRPSACEKCGGSEGVEKVNTPRGITLPPRDSDNDRTERAVVWAWLCQACTEAYIRRAVEVRALEDGPLSKGCPRCGDPKPKAMVSGFTGNLARPDAFTRVCGVCHDSERRERAGKLKVVSRERVPFRVGESTMVGTIRLKGEEPPFSSGNCCSIGGRSCRNMSSENVTAARRKWPELEAGVDVDVLEDGTIRVVDERLPFAWRASHLCTGCGYFEDAALKGFPDPDGKTPVDPMPLKGTKWEKPPTPPGGHRARCPYGLSLMLGDNGKGKECTCAPAKPPEELSKLTAAVAQSQDAVFANTLNRGQNGTDSKYFCEDCHSRWEKESQLCERHARKSEAP